MSNDRWAILRKTDGVVVGITESVLTSADPSNYAYVEAPLNVPQTDEYYINAFNNYDELPILKKIKAAFVDSYRLDVEHAGIQYTFPDDVVGTIQTRDDVDFRNLNALMVTSLALSAQGITDPIFTLRDMENHDHPLTPNQMTAVGMTATQHISNCYKIGWYVKYVINSKATVQEVHDLDIAETWIYAKQQLGL